MFDAEFWQSISESVSRLLVALLAGAIIGFEREWRARTAGLRTHILVAIGAATYMMVSEEIIETFTLRSEELQMDPLRTVAGLVGGVGFLGAGAIVQARGNVRGLTTAASIWMVAALGMAAGVGAYRTVTLASLVVIIVLIPLRLLEKKLRHNRKGRRNKRRKRANNAQSARSSATDITDT